MNEAEYTKYCESFFHTGCFLNEATLNETIGNMAPVEFNKWNSSIALEYLEYLDCMSASAQTDIAVDVIAILLAELDKYTIYQQKYAEFEKYYDNFMEDDRLKILVGDKEYRAESSIDVLWSGWEGDETAWLVIDNGQKKLVISDHGHKEFGTKEFLKEKIAEYEIAIANTKLMLEEL